MNIKDDWIKIREYPDRSSVWKNTKDWFAFCNPLSLPQHADSDLAVGDIASRWLKIADEIESASSPG